MRFWLWVIWRIISGIPLLAVWALFYLILKLTNQTDDYIRSQKINGNHAEPVKTLKRYYK